MKPINFPGAHEVGKLKNMTDEQCRSIWAHNHDYEYTGTDGNQYPGRVWTEVWQPSEKDIEAIKAGRPIVLHIHSDSLPPISLFTMDENNNQNIE